MKIESVPISKVKINPNNPRIIKDERFAKLVRSIREFPKMLEIRPIVVNDAMVVLGGNMRLRACKEAGLKQVHIIRASELTEEEQRRFIIADNVGFGEHDWDMLANEWDADQLAEWGLDAIGYGSNQDEKKEGDTIGAWVPDCLFPSNNTYEIPTLDIEQQAELITNPVTLWGVDARTRKIEGGTILFYVDDYRFEAIWANPGQIAQSGCQAIAEPNLSMYDTMPVSYALHLIYKKRWIARYLQTLGVKILVDLNVSTKFEEYNLLGVPDGWNAFATRGYTDRLENLEREIEIAQKVSGLKNPLLLVYGGGQKVREIVAKNNNDR